MSENVGASTSRNPKGLHGLYGDNFTFIIQTLDNKQDMKIETPLQKLVKLRIQ
jgi:hypothetical protein